MKHALPSISSLTTDYFSSSNTLAQWLTLWRAPEIKPTQLFQLIAAFPDFQTIFDVSSQQRRKLLHPLALSQKTLSFFDSPPQKDLDNDLTWAAQNNHHILTWQDERYPPLLREIGSPPFVLFVLGTVECLKHLQLAMVGSRNPTPGGIETAREFAHSLSAIGFTITSGLALGIDGASHQSALDSNAPTIAVIGTGIDRIYPARHKQLAQQIIENGAIVSEFPLGTPPQPYNFPRRNRIISGLSRGTLVIEAARKSGSLITARFSVEQGREVFAIPGSIDNPLAKGCHLLIRQGAKLVETIEDILEEFPSIEIIEKKKTNEPITHKEHKKNNNKNEPLLRFLNRTPTSIDTLITRSGLTAHKVSSILLSLELQGIVRTVTGGYVKNSS